MSTASDKADSVRHDEDEATKKADADAKQAAADAKANELTPEEKAWAAIDTVRHQTAHGGDAVANALEAIYGKPRPAPRANTRVWKNKNEPHGVLGQVTVVRGDVSVVKWEDGSTTEVHKKDLHFVDDKKTS